MELFSVPPRWRRYLFSWRRHSQKDIDAELQFHFQTRREALMAEGLSADAAQARALEEFGDVGEVRRNLNEIDARMARRERWLDRLDAWRQDLVYAVRSLRRTPGVTLTIIVTLALGLGVNAAMFSLLNAVFLRPPAGVTEPGQVRRVWSELTFFRTGKQFWSGYDYQEFEAVRDAVVGLATAVPYLREPGKVGRGAEAIPIRTVHTSTDYFRLLGVRPARGRFFSEEEDRLGAGHKVVVASHAFWSRALGGDPAVIGRSIALSGEAHTLIGVAAPEFHGVDLDAIDVWIPLGSQAVSGRTPWWLNPNVNGFQVLLRTREGSSIDELDARATIALRRLAVERRSRDSTTVARTGALIRARGPGKLEQEVQIAQRLGGVALIVLLIACANVVNLLLARAVRRRREIAMRLALGISRGRLTRLVMTESVLLAFVAGAGAIVAAQWGGVALRALLLPDVHWAQSPLDWRVLTAALLATILAGLAAGAVPALQSGATELTEVLKTGAREGFVRRSRTRSLLVAAQAALSVVLLVGAALFVRSLSNVRGLDLGFDARGLLFGDVAFDTRDPGRDSLEATRMADVAERLRSTPGVVSTALTHMRPMWGLSTEAYFPDADTIAHRKPEGMFWAVSPEYFATMGIRLVAGRGFPPPGGVTSPSVIVNATMAEALWPGESPLGRCVRFRQPDGRCNTVIGVVETARWGAVIEDATPQFYLPLGNLPFPERASRVLVVRARPEGVAAVSRAVRSALLDAFPGGAPVVESMGAMLASDYRPWRLGATLFSLFGMLAAVVAAVGVYSTVSYNVAQRTHELGVRIALGARVADVLRHVLADGLRTTVAGVVVGVLLSVAGGRLVASLLYGVTPYDAASIGAVVVLLLGVTAASALVPGWRATRVDPVTALRAE